MVLLRASNNVTSSETFQNRVNKSNCKGWLSSNC